MRKVVCFERLYHTMGNGGASIFVPVYCKTSYPYLPIPCIPYVHGLAILVNIWNNVLIGAVDMRKHNEAWQEKHI